MATASGYIPVLHQQVALHSNSSLSEPLHCFEASLSHSVTVPVPLLAHIHSNSLHTPPTLPTLTQHIPPNRFALPHHLNNRPRIIAIGLGVSAAQTHPPPCSSEVMNSLVPSVTKQRVPGTFPTFCILLKLSMPVFVDFHLVFGQISTHPATPKKFPPILTTPLHQLRLLQPQLPCNSRRRKYEELKKMARQNAAKAGKRDLVQWNPIEAIVGQWWGEVKLEVVCDVTPPLASLRCQHRLRSILKRQENQEQGGGDWLGGMFDVWFDRDL